MSVKEHVIFLDQVMTKDSGMARLTDSSFTAEFKELQITLHHTCCVRHLGRQNGQFSMAFVC